MFKFLYWGYNLFTKNCIVNCMHKNYNSSHKKAFHVKKNNLKIIYLVVPKQRRNYKLWTYCQNNKRRYFNKYSIVIYPHESKKNRLLELYYLHYSSGIFGGILSIPEVYLTIYIRQISLLFASLTNSNRYINWSLVQRD